MGMSECIKCWDNVCSCGYEYRDFSKEEMVEFLSGLLKYNEHTKEGMKLLFNQLFNLVEVTQ
jgi:hypothetical protein